MPCTTNHDHDGLRRPIKMPCNTYQGNNEALHKRYEGRHEELARMLCKCCLALETAGAIFLPDIKKWWDEHKQWDKETSK